MKTIQVDVVDYGTCDFGGLQHQLLQAENSNGHAEVEIRGEEAAVNAWLLDHGYDEEGR